MKESTETILKQLENARWFQTTGQQDTNDAIVLSSRAEAIANCSSIEWANLRLDTSNEYGEQLRQHSTGRYNEWNLIVNELKPVTSMLVKRKTQQAVEKYQLPRLIIDFVNWDILGVVIEYENIDMCPVGFDASLLDWYLRGHFPCGWQGSFPEGKLIVY